MYRFTSITFKILCSVLFKRKLERGVYKLKLYYIATYLVLVSHIMFHILVLVSIVIYTIKYRPKLIGN